MYRTHKIAQRRGFTIIELLIVVIVIGVLASAGVAKYQGFAENAKSRTCVSNQSVVENACAIWQTQNTAVSESGWGACRFRKDGGSMAVGSGTGYSAPPFSPNATPAFKIADVVRDPKAFICPKVLSDYGDAFGNVPAVNETLSNVFGYGCGAPCYLWYYNSASSNGGTTWNGAGGYFDISAANSSALQVAICEAYGGAKCTPTQMGIDRKYKHANKWN